MMRRGVRGRRWIWWSRWRQQQWKPKQWCQHLQGTWVRSALCCYSINIMHQHLDHQHDYWHTVDVQAGDDEEGEEDSGTESDDEIETEPLDGDSEGCSKWWWWPWSWSWSWSWWWPQWGLKKGVIIRWKKNFLTFISLNQMLNAVIKMGIIVMMVTILVMKMWTSV